MNIPVGMVKDEHFHLLLHNDRELERLIGGTMAGRETFHHWPLSNVQRINGSAQCKFQWIRGGKPFHP